MTIALDLSAANRPAPAGKPSLAGMTRAQLREALIEAGLVEEKKAKMRADQLWRWIYHYGVTEFEAMTNVSKVLRAELEARFTLARPEVVERQISRDGTRKYLIRFAPGVEAETVFIPSVGKSGALCVSSQVGCTLNCTFCHTGTQKLVRNLTAAEIAAQVMIARDDLGEWPTSNEDRQITNIVFMGMGEPLYNLDHVADAIDVISDGDGISIGRRRITVSTSGVVPKIPELGERTRAMLAISLHATNDALRDELVPINKRYPIADLLDAIRAYPDLSNAKRVTFEYVMLKGVNDSPAEAKELVRLLQGIPSKINLIPFNPWPGSNYECSDWETIERFAEIVNRAGYASPIRTPRGRDILAACGQLKSESEKMRASERRALERAAQNASPAETAKAHLYGEGANLA
ncbi:23S rRNA (adenine(2503)-C(2))-methyltransferase RlmN [Marinicauda algicola]|uniref:Dual-specificity RNA methyltransferase RlmN n=1 Tax=Marinicauda algicola TaxID=2029849 RepID=A0A4S2H0R7_9PROT|nr:23S rRNA (adenine(2503)-C(2))-methyltransferase RlmN [Marinicauda algicola]TGY89086.1 23S rRNA (adenine(2503)-C(2))-methyltransferase RlmN [Marinicauda algicola]